MWQVLLFTMFALLLGALVWWVWQQRELARRQTETAAELAALGKGVRALTHDLRQTLDLIVATVERARVLTPHSLPEVLGGLEQAARGAADLVRTFGDGDVPKGTAVPTTAEGIVRLGVLLQRSAGVPVELRVSGTVRYLGLETDALRVLLNLLSNAVREAAQIPDGRVSVEIGDRRLTITNPIRDPALLDERIYDEGTSHVGSAGLGLATARRAAASVGWSLRYEVTGGTVSFIVDERPDAFVSAGGALQSAL